MRGIAGFMDCRQYMLGGVGGLAVQDKTRDWEPWDG